MGSPDRRRPDSRYRAGPGSPIRVWDAAAKEYRPAQYRDIVVLLRTMDGWAQTFVAVFLQEGIPAVAQQKKGYFSAYEVQLICNFLRVIDNPYQGNPADVCAGITYRALYR